MAEEQTKTEGWKDLYFKTAAERNAAQKEIDGLKVKNQRLLERSQEAERQLLRLRSELPEGHDLVTGKEYRELQDKYHLATQVRWEQIQELRARCEMDGLRLKSLEEQNRKLVPFGDAVSGKVHRELDKELREQIQYLEDKNHELSLLCEIRHTARKEAGLREKELQSHPAIVLDTMAKPLAIHLWEAAVRNIASIAELLEKMPPDVHGRFVAIEEVKRLTRAINWQFKKGL